MEYAGNIYLTRFRGCWTFTSMATPRKTAQKDTRKPQKAPVVIGIDPGFTGALVAVSGSKIVDWADMPVRPDRKGNNELDCRAVLDWLRKFGEDTIVWTEKVGAMCGDGAAGAFSFGCTVGALMCAVAASSFRQEWVTPATWKKAFGLIMSKPAKGTFVTSKEEKAAKAKAKRAIKGVARGRAQEAFPAHADIFSRVKDDGRAEAALIALFGQRQALAGAF